MTIEESSKAKLQLSVVEDLNGAAGSSDDGVKNPEPGVAGCEGLLEEAKMRAQAAETRMEKAEARSVQSKRGCAGRGAAERPETSGEGRGRSGIRRCGPQN